MEKWELVCGGNKCYFLKCMNNKHATTIFGCLLSFCTFEILASCDDTHLRQAGFVVSNINELVAEILDLDHYIFMIFVPSSREVSESSK